MMEENRACCYRFWYVIIYLIVSTLSSWYYTHKMYYALLQHSNPSSFNTSDALRTSFENGLQQEANKYASCLQGQETHATSHMQHMKNTFQLQETELDTTDKVLLTCITSTKDGNEYNSCLV